MILWMSGSSRLVINLLVQVRIAMHLLILFSVVGCLPLMISSARIRAIVLIMTGSKKSVNNMAVALAISKIFMVDILSVTDGVG